MIAGKYDRISSLPDAILVDILSLIALNDAVTTSFVSRRWLHLWAEVTTIYIVIKQSKGPFKYWTTFAKKILPKLTSPLIRRFCLDIECGVNKYGLEQIDLWFNRVLDRWKIEEIKVTTNGYEGLISFPVIFQIHSLLVLELYGDLSLNLPLNVVKIPNLKKLAIQINFTQTKQCMFFETLMKSCPLLEDLSLHFCAIICRTGYLVPNKISLLGPNLKKLNISFSGQNLMKTIVIDAPNLEYLKLGSSNYGLPNFSFVDTPTMLVEAYISGNLSKGEVTTNFFKAISRVRSLGVWRPMIGGAMTTMFVNLTRLICTMPCSGKDSKALLGLLERCPLLETLTVNFTSSGTWEYLWLLCYIEAPNVLIRTKKVEMHFMSSLMLNNDALNLIKYLLTHARVLDRFIIKITTDPSGEILEEEKIQEVEACKEIFDWVRFLSTGYQVEFWGRYLRIIQSGEECKFIKGPNGYIIYILLLNCLAVFNVLDSLDFDVGSVFRNLVHLTLDLSTNEKDWGDRIPIPICLLSLLNKIKLLNTQGNANDVKLLKYIISNATVMERLYISSVYDGYGDDDDDDDERGQLWKEYKLSRTLFLVPKNSKITVNVEDNLYGETPGSPKSARQV